MEKRNHIRTSRRMRGLERALIFLIGLLVLIGALLVLNRSGWRLEWSLQKINYLRYDHANPNFTFRYPDYFRFDADPKKISGSDYMAGFKLKTDQRTGCDIRIASFSLDLKKSDQEIRGSIEEELSQNAKEATLISGKKMKLGGEEAFSAEFSLIDPTGNLVRLSQVLTSHDGIGYRIVCGTGDYQYRYFQKDFADFYDSFRWKR